MYHTHGIKLGDTFEYLVNKRRYHVIDIQDDDHFIIEWTFPNRKGGVYRDQIFISLEILLDEFRKIDKSGSVDK